MDRRKGKSIDSLSCAPYTSQTKKEKGEYVRLNFFNSFLEMHFYIVSQTREKLYDFICYQSSMYQT